MCGSVQGETPFSQNETLLTGDAVKFFAGTPAGDEVITGRSEEFFIATPTPGDPRTPPRAALEDHWVMPCIGKPAGETMGESEPCGLAHHLRDTRLLIEALVDESFLKGRPEEFFIGTPTPGMYRTSCQDGSGDDDEVSTSDDELSGVAERSVPKRAARPDGEIRGATGKSVNGKATLNQGLDTAQRERSVPPDVCGRCALQAPTFMFEPPRFF